MYKHLADEKSSNEASDNYQPTSHRSSKKNEYQSSGLEKALEELGRGNFEEKWATAKILVRYGDVVIEPLQEVILDEQADLEHRCFALRILSQIKNPRIVLIVTQLLSFTQEEELISLATQTLGIQGESAIDFLTCLLEDSQYRLLACQALAQIPNKRVIEPLLSVVDDKHYEIRKIAITVLRNFNDPQVLQILIKGLGDFHPDVRKESLVGLGLKLKQNKEAPLIAIISPLLNDLNLDVAQQAAMSLSRCRHILAVSALRKTLESEFAPIPLKLTVIRVLGWIATPESIACLGKFLDNEDTLLSIEIIKVLGRVSGSHSLKEIAIDILNDFYENQPFVTIAPEILQVICYSWTQLEAITAIPLLKEIENSQDHTAKAD